MRCDEESTLALAASIASGADAASDSDSDAEAFASLLSGGENLFEESESQVAKRKKAEEFAANYRQRAWGLRNRLLQTVNDKANDGGVVEHHFALVDQKPPVVFLEKQGQQAKVWDCALVLARFLTHPSFFPSRYFEGKRVIELGCGIGVPGISAAALGASEVLLTDMDVAVPWIQVNIERNAALFNGSVRAQALWWGHPNQHMEPFDVILCSDLIYGEPKIAEALVQTIVALCHDNTVVVSCHEARFAGDQGTSFFDAMTAQSFVIEPVSFDQLDKAYRAVNVHVNVVTKKKILVELKQ